MEIYVVISEKNILPNTIIIMNTTLNIDMLYVDIVHYARR